MKQQSFIYNFLLNPQYRLWRYVALILFFGIVSLNQALVGYKDIMPQMGNKLYWIMAGTISTYIITVYLVIKILMKLLVAGRYMLFIGGVILCAFFYLAIPNTIYLLYIDGYDLFSEVVLIDNLSAFVIYVLCISGVIIPVFLRNWIISNQYLSLLKIRQETSQVEQLKEQINPKSFFKVLNKSKSLVKTEPDRASSMLMKLGQLLRYQLYDCNRSTVLLSAELTFIRNFLELEKLCSSIFNYKLTSTESINGIFISPSVLLPYVQSIINSFNMEAELHTIDVQINHSDENIHVLIKIKGIESISLLKKELSKVEERLDILCENNYTLSIQGENPADETAVMLQLTKQ